MGHRSVGKQPEGWLQERGVSQRELLTALAQGRLGASQLEQGMSDWPLEAKELGEEGVEMYQVQVP